MWICPKCSRENGNSFSSCKSCGYVISPKEKEFAIENTKKKIANFNQKRSTPKNTYGHSGYTGPKVDYDDDDSYLEDYYTDDMFDDDDYVKKSKKRIIIPIIVILLIFAIGAGALYYLNEKGYINIFSSTDFTYTESEKGIMITGYKGKDTTLEIPDVVDGNIVSGIESKAFAESTLKSVTLPNTVKYIGERAFFHCEYLHFVSMQDGVKEIGSYAFASCPVITDTFIPQSVENIGENIFKDSGNVYIQGVMGSVAMSYALDNDVNFTPTDEGANPLTVTPIRTNNMQTLTTSKTGYAAGCIFSFVPYEDSKYKITVEASIDGYLKINEFGTMGKFQSEESKNGRNHQTTLTADLKKEKKYYFAIESQGEEANKNIEYSILAEAVTDEQTKADTEAKSWIGKTYTFTAYTDLFYDQHSETGTSHYLEWNTNNQEVIDYYVEEDGTVWLAINAPDESQSESTIWWHKIEQ